MCSVNFVSTNEALVLEALEAGVSVVAAYPVEPIFIPLLTCYLREVVLEDEVCSKTSSKGMAKGSGGSKHTILHKKSKGWRK
jgi:hypothetical protein